MTDLYKTLGIDKKADKEAIKKAYRKAAKKSHPDGGGDKKSFALVKRARDILMDDNRRAKYDSTGDESETQPNNEISDVINYIRFHFSAVLEELAQQGTSPLIVDIVSRTKSKMGDSLAANQKTLRVTKTVLEFDQKMKGRFTKKEKAESNIFENILTHRIQSLNLSIANLEKMIATHTKCMEMIKGFTYRADKDLEANAQNMQGLFNIVFTSNY